MEIKPFYDARTFTMTYVVYDPATKDAVIIDPVLDYDPAASKIWRESVDGLLAFTQSLGLNVHFVLETHAHADHLSGSQLLKAAYPQAQVAIGERITVVQDVFRKVFDLENFTPDGSQFDRLLKDGETVQAGSLNFKVMFTPGHTPACACYQFDDAVFTGDAIFMPDMGTGRCDFPAGSVHDLYRSIQETLYSLPDETRVFVGHDYLPGGRELAFETTIGEQKRANVQLKVDTTEADFTAFRSARDKALAAPKLLFPSVQVNIDAGRLPAESAHPEAGGRRYLKVPLNLSALV